MVSSRKLLGKSPLIVITVGTSGKVFDRVFYNLDEIVQQLENKPVFLVQNGNYNYKWRYKRVIEKHSLNPKQLILTIKKADRIIAHAGIGTLYLVSKYAKNMPLIVARQPQLHEVVDSHQIKFIRYLNDNLPLKFKRFFIDDNIDINNKVRQYLTVKPVKNILKNFLFQAQGKKNLIIKIDQFIKNILG